jgi:hypothetical protein
MTVTYVSIRQHTSAYVSAYLLGSQSFPRMTVTYVSIRQHTSAYVSIRQRIPAGIPVLSADYCNIQSLHIGPQLYQGIGSHVLDTEPLGMRLTLLVERRLL